MVLYWDFWADTWPFLVGRIYDDGGCSIVFICSMQRFLSGHCNLLFSFSPLLVDDLCFPVLELATAIGEVVARRTFRVR